MAGTLGRLRPSSSRAVPGHDTCAGAELASNRRHLNSARRRSQPLGGGGGTSGRGSDGGSPSGPGSSGAWISGMTFSKFAGGATDGAGMALRVGADKNAGSSGAGALGAGALGAGPIDGGG